MTNDNTEAGIFAVDLEARTVEGILLPWGEKSKLSMSRTEPIYFDRGTVELPVDVSIVTLNKMHDQFTPVGRAVAVEDRDAGIWARFAIAKTPEGDQFLTHDYPNKIMTKLSAEVRGMVRDTANSARALKAILTGAALCDEGAFESAALFAVDTTGTAASTTPAAPADPNAPPATPQVTIEKNVQTLTDANGAESIVTTTKTTTVEPDGTTKVETAVVTEPAATPAQAQGATTVGNATIPGTLAASAASLVTPDTEPDKQGARDVFALITKAMHGDTDAERMLAALTDIKVTGSGALPAAGVLQPNWLGEVWKQKTYNRRYIPLIGHGDIKAIEEKGFTVTAGTEPVQAWNGNKAQLPSSGGTSDLISATFQRWGWAADIAREFFDIPGNEEVIAAFLRLVANSYARVTDKWTLAQLVAAATIVAPDTYPTLDVTRDYPTSIKQLIQGVDAISSDPIDDTPAFAVANALAWKEIIYAPKDALPEWLSLDFGITDQTGTADGKVHLVRGDIGIADTSAIMVGAFDAAHVNELAGASPLNLSALDLANGGVDHATVGYTQFMADYADAIVTIGVADV